VYSHFQLARKYIRYYLQAANSKGHGMHSPFVFDFIRYVLNNKGYFQPPAFIEDLRKDLLRDKTVLEIQDLGAGSRISASKQRTMQKVAATAVKPRKFGHFFYRMVKHYQPGVIVELGTSLGVTTAYLAAANSSARVITIEGSDAIYHTAQKNFHKLRLQNIEALQGNFDTVLPDVLQRLDKVDLAYIDGNHRYAPTMEYFHQLLKKTHSPSTLIFDDIHWSPQMEKAWSAVKSHPDVLCTVDLFFLGLVFFRKEFKEKQHFSIRF
jgi:predicted O-methyltransferase YrrM